jgi:Mrr N-terminal domain
MAPADPLNSLSNNLLRFADQIAALDKGPVLDAPCGSIFENDVHWARFYLVKAGLLGNARRGLWSLTTEGHEKRLSQEETWDLYVRIRGANRPSGSQAEEDVPAPGTEGDNEEGKSYWFGV